MKRVPYTSTIGSLMYVMVCIRPDITHVMRVVSRYMSNPGRQHWDATKWILRYLRGITDRTLCFKGASVKLKGFVDSDLGGDVDNMKSTTGYVYIFGGTTLSWASKFQKIIALSTIEAEYIVVIKASKEMIWLQSFLEELGKKHENSVLYNDSQSAIHLAKNPVFHFRMKHIQLRYHFIRSHLEEGVLSLKKIHGSQNPVDMLTKVVIIEKLKVCSASVGLRP